MGRMLLTKPFRTERKDLNFTFSGQEWEIIYERLLPLLGAERMQLLDGTWPGGNAGLGGRGAGWRCRSPACEQLQLDAPAEAPGWSPEQRRSCCSEERMGQEVPMKGSAATLDA